MLFSQDIKKLFKKIVYIVKQKKELKYIRFNINIICVPASDA